MNNMLTYGHWSQIIVNSLIFIIFAFSFAKLPILVLVYKKLARSEEQEALAEFGKEYSHYMAEIPGFIPRLG